MKSKEREKFDLLLMRDSDLTTGHLKTMLLFMNKKEVLASDISSLLDCKPQYSSKIIKELLIKRYIKCAGKIKSTRILVYSLNIDKIYEIENQMSIDDFLE